MHRSRVFDRRDTPLINRYQAEVPSYDEQEAVKIANARDSPEFSSPVRNNSKSNTMERLFDPLSIAQTTDEEVGFLNCPQV